LDLEVGVVRCLPMKWQDKSYWYVFGKETSIKPIIKAYKEPNGVEDFSKAMIKMFEYIQKQL